MTRCIEEMQVKYENDRFGAILRPLQPGMPADGPREWRIKCFDCPGKVKRSQIVDGDKVLSAIVSSTQVYTPGPEETLTNFEVHLKNKRHRDNVNARLARERGSAS
ncbi:SWI/SNF chromatin-remodeling complex subunit [Tulasnella sp. 419]|nr:SWI/SNF chromatin-remodeling complex subunit [Tulasnella sp. 419]